MRWILLIMTGIGFTLGLLCGLLLQLPATGLPADRILQQPSDPDIVRSRRNVEEVHSPGPSPLRTDSEVAKAVINDAGAKGENLESVGARSRAAPNSENSIEDKKSRASSPVAPNRLKSDDRQANDGGERLNSVDHSTDLGSPRGENVLSHRGQWKGENNHVTGTIKQWPPAEDKSVHIVKDPVANNSQQIIDLSKTSSTFTVRLKNNGGKIVVDASYNVKDEKAEGLQETDPADNATSQTGKIKSLEQIVSGVLWLPELEQQCPLGFQPQDIEAWRRGASQMRVVGVEEGCGRMQNRLLTFQDASKACARYRLNTDQLQGEVYSYYLALLLNITNLPPAAMLPVDSRSDQWKAVHLDLSMAQWSDGRLIVLTKWVNDLTPAHIPEELREDERQLYPTLEILGSKSIPELCELVQWSDLIVFDYLTANLDRMVNNMFNKQWNPDMMRNPAHNLEMAQGGQLVFLDNESGLFHGYRLLDKYSEYHESLLRSLCVFRPSTARAVKALHEADSVHVQLQRLLQDNEAHHRHLPAIPEKNILVLKERLTNVYRQIKMCEELFDR